MPARNSDATDTVPPGAAPCADTWKLAVPATRAANVHSRVPDAPGPSVFEAFHSPVPSMPNAM